VKGLSLNFSPHDIIGSREPQLVSRFLSSPQTGVHVEDPAAEAVNGGEMSSADLAASSSAVEQWTAFGTASHLAVGEQPEEALDLVDPGARGRVKWMCQGVPWYEARCDPTGLAPDPRITPGALHRSPPAPEQFVDDSPLERMGFEPSVPLVSEPLDSDMRRGKGGSSGLEGTSQLLWGPAVPLLELGEFEKVEI
jgi:hypothetical protein